MCPAGPKVEKSIKMIKKSQNPDHLDDSPGVAKLCPKRRISHIDAF